ncbi:hypothetical protein MNBD_GAMMA26-965 [hydrothermal vent metagenome]|uniref:Uncharacterized protein n=1 Tax=hydrothermal vent metagenome TaxID=652676 RepID=A0A3B1B7D0_9ZZZZ
MSKTKTIGFLFALLTLLTNTAFAGQNLKEYTLGSGDKIKIMVFGEEDLTVETLVGDSGTISFPLLGEITVKKQTPSSIEALVTKRLKGPYLIDPKVTVSILEYRQFFVNGRVEKPGGFPFQPGMTVRQAISLAGGFEERANKGRIFVVNSDSISDRPVPITIDAHVQPGDIITVERSFF